jgi:hypothetical protein
MIMEDLGPLYIVVRDHDHQNIESPQNTSKAHPVELQLNHLLMVWALKCEVPQILEMK